MIILFIQHHVVMSVDKFKLLKHCACIEGLPLINSVLNVLNKCMHTHTQSYIPHIINWDITLVIWNGDHSRYCHFDTTNGRLSDQHCVALAVKNIVLFYWQECPSIMKSNKGSVNLF